MAVGEGDVCACPGCGGNAAIRASDGARYGQEGSDLQNQCMPNPLIALECPLVPCAAARAVCQQGACTPGIPTGAGVADGGSTGDAGP